MYGYTIRHDLIVLRRELKPQGSYDGQSCFLGDVAAFTEGSIVAFAGKFNLLRFLSHPRGVYDDSQRVRDIARVARLF